MSSAAQIDAPTFPRLLDLRRAPAEAGGPIPETKAVQVGGLPGLLIAFSAEEWARWKGAKPEGFTPIAGSWVKVLFSAG